MRKGIFITLVAMLCFSGLIILYNQKIEQADNSFDNLIKLLDPSKYTQVTLHEMGVYSVDDVRFKIKDKDIIELRFGRVNVPIKVSDITGNPAIVRDLKKIGVDLTITKKGSIKIKYKGEEVKKVE